MIRIILKSILAGICIGIGAIAYMSVDKLIAPFVFCIGLILIFKFKLHLYTGVVPYVKSIKDVPYLATVLIGNIIGCCLMFVFPMDLAEEIILNKVQQNYLQMIVSAILCNFLIFSAVEFNKVSNNLGVIASVSTFVICGFNHSIANICFMISARYFELKSFILVILSILGNALGGILFRRLMILYEDSKDRKKLCG